jgi:hypothetical protein
MLILPQAKAGSGQGGGSEHIHTHLLAFTFTPSLCFVLGLNLHDDFVYHGLVSLELLERFAAPCLLQPQLLVEFRLIPAVRWNVVSWGEFFVAAAAAAVVVVVVVVVAVEVVLLMVVASVALGSNRLRLRCAAQRYVAVHRVKVHCVGVSSWRWWWREPCRA